MKAPIQSFCSKIRTASVCFEAHIHLYSDKVIISRFGKTGPLPEETTINFFHISDIFFGRSGGRSWITFRRSEDPSATPDLTAMIAANIPYHDEYSIIFGLNKEPVSFQFFTVVKETFEQFRNA